ncbi:MAG: sensor histidine kinase [Ilyomonas sp.]
MKISSLIFSGFLFILLLFSITTYINSRQAEKVKANAEYVSQSSTIVRQSNRFQRNILNMVSGLRGYLLTGEEYFIQAYNASVSENDAILKELAILSKEDSVQQVEFEKIKSLNNELTQKYNNIIENAREERRSNHKTTTNLRSEYKVILEQETENKTDDNLQQTLRRFINYEYEKREVRKNNLASLVSRTKNISFGLTLFSVVAGFVIALTLAYSISKRVRKMVNMADSIAQGNYDMRLEDKSKDEVGQLAVSLNHMSKTLSETIHALQRKNEELDQYAHIVSHDLKSPLRGMGNVISWIEEDHREELTPKVQEYFEIIKGRLSKAENLIRSILLYAKVDSRNHEKEQVDVKELVDEITESIAIKEGIKINVNKNLPVVFTEKIPLFQVLSNLISNAIKHHDKEKGEVKIYHKELPDHYEFFVADDGPGIAKNYLNKIFVIFQTLQQSNSFESTGVGLAIVKKILDKRQEKISITSEPGKGSVFSFTWTK